MSLWEVLSFRSLRGFILRTSHTEWVLLINFPVLSKDGAKIRREWSFCNDSNQWNASKIIDCCQYVVSIVLNTSKIFVLLGAQKQGVFEVLFTQNQYPTADIVFVFCHFLKSVPQTIGWNDPAYNGREYVCKHWHTAPFAGPCLPKTLVGFDFDDNTQVIVFDEKSVACLDRGLKCCVFI